MRAPTAQKRHGLPGLSSERGRWWVRSSGRAGPRTGEELEARVEVNRGGPGNPLSDEELARKFHDNAVRSLPEEARG
ncbi:MAG: MmgE/PrpD C-terminal domain, partial [Gaiellales bacterium]|nr:MmgE/PrpD C-terminal domain [Gaiellales bacterium]